jgi:hypothetical protein
MSVLNKTTTENRAEERLAEAIRLVHRSYGSNLGNFLRAVQSSIEPKATIRPHEKSVSTGGVRYASSRS